MITFVISIRWRILMVNNDRYYQTLKSARYYYELGKTQQEIADELQISRPTVAKYLREAKDAGMVEIRVLDIRNKNSVIDLESALRDSFGLKFVRIVEVEHASDEALKEKLGEETARHLERLVKNGSSIGVSWGTTLKAAADALRQNRNLHGVKVVTLVGGASRLDSTIHANVLCERIAARCGGTSSYLYAPAIVDSAETAEKLRKSTEIKAVLDLARSVDIALVGIGSPDETSSIVRTGYFGAHDLRQLREYKVVGDICTRFYDEQGAVSPLALNDRIIGIDLADLRSIGHVIGVAGGPKKIRAIRGALRAGFINSLITDAATAKSVLRRDSQERRYPNDTSA